MQKDFLQLARTLGRDFRELSAMADRLAEQANPDAAAALIETRCAQGGTTLIFPASKSITDREKLAGALATMARRKIELKRGQRGD